jgi:radical SAM protein with 4Fe4S-binding SPASM domain
MIPHRKTPAAVYLTAENRCNLKCKSCAIWEDMAETDDKGEPRLSAEEMYPLIDRIKAWGDVEHIAFDTIGEPFLDKSFEDYVAHANRQGFSTSTVTNGMPLTETRALKVIKSGLRYISFSIDSPIAEVHDEIRGQQGAFDKTFRNIQLLQRMKKAHAATTGEDRPAIMIISVVSRDNFRDIDKMADLVLKLQVPRLRLVYAATVDEQTSQNLNLQSEDAKTNAHRFELKAEDLHIDEEDMPLLMEKLGLLACKCNTYGIHLDLAINAANVSRKCGVLWNQTFIDKFGNVYPCGMMTDTHLGNIRHRSLDEIWNGDGYAKLREMLHKRNSGQIYLDICEHCCILSRIKTRPKAAEPADETQPMPALIRSAT